MIWEELRTLRTRVATHPDLVSRIVALEAEVERLKTDMADRPYYMPLYPAYPTWEPSRTRCETTGTTKPGAGHWRIEGHDAYIEGDAT